MTLNAASGTTVDPCQCIRREKYIVAGTVAEFVGVFPEPAAVHFEERLIHVRQRCSRGKVGQVGKMFSVRNQSPLRETVAGNPNAILAVLQVIFHGISDEFGAFRRRGRRTALRSLYPVVRALGWGKLRFLPFHYPGQEFRLFPLKFDLGDVSQPPDIQAPLAGFASSPSYHMMTKL
jgi:hypothetical protein